MFAPTFQGSAMLTASVTIAHIIKNVKSCWESALARKTGGSRMNKENAAGIFCLMPLILNYFKGEEPYEKDHPNF